MSVDLSAFYSMMKVVDASISKIEKMVQSRDEYAEFAKRYGLSADVNNGVVFLNETTAIVKLDCRGTSALSVTNKFKKTKDSTLPVETQMAMLSDAQTLVVFSAKEKTNEEIVKKGFQVVEKLRLIENKHTPASVNKSSEFLIVYSRNRGDKKLLHFYISMFKHRISCFSDKNLRNTETLRELKKNAALYTSDRVPTAHQTEVMDDFAARFPHLETFYCPVSSTLSFNAGKHPEGKMGAYSRVGVVDGTRRHILTNEGFALLRGIDALPTFANKTDCSAFIHSCVHPFYIQTILDLQFL